MRRKYFRASVETDMTVESLAALALADKLDRPVFSGRRWSAGAVIRELVAERDALRAALHDAAQSLTTIAENAGRRLNTDGTENYLFHFDQVRGYARSRAGVAIDAARATGEHHE